MSVLTPPITTAPSVALPTARGPWSEVVLDRLTSRNQQPVRALPHGAPTAEDLHLALYLCYELHYGGLPGVDADMEWDPGLLTVRAELERAFEGELRVATPPAPDVALDELVPVLLEAVPCPSLSDRVASDASIGQLREYVLHRSAYQRKEGDPHTWAIPRLRRAAKQQLVHILVGEYGAEEPGQEVHAELFALTMRELGLDDRPNAHLDRLPASSLAVSNIVSMFGLHRRLRGALVGHLALSEMTSVAAMRRYVTGMQRLDTSAAAQRFFEVHVLADAVHEVMVMELLRAVVADEPALLDEVAFGISASLVVERSFAVGLLQPWDRGASAMR